MRLLNVLADLKQREGAGYCYTSEEGGQTNPQEHVQDKAILDFEWTATQVVLRSVNHKVLEPTEASHTGTMRTVCLTLGERARQMPPVHADCALIKVLVLSADEPQCFRR